MNKVTKTAEELALRYESMIRDILRDHDARSGRLIVLEQTGDLPRTPVIAPHAPRPRATETGATATTEPPPIQHRFV